MDLFDVLPVFDECELKKRATLWVLHTEGRRGATRMATRMRRDRALFSTSNNDKRAELHKNPIIVEAAEAVFTEVCAKSGAPAEGKPAASLDEPTFAHVWRCWYAAFVGAHDAEAYDAAYARAEFAAAANGADYLNMVDAICAILQFAHLWCDELEMQGYMTFLEAMRSNTLAMPPAPSPTAAPTSDAASSLPPAPLSPWNSPLATPSAAGADSTGPVAPPSALVSCDVTPQHAPLRRGLRVVWVPGLDDVSPKTLGGRLPSSPMFPHATANPRSTPVALQDGLPPAMTKLDSEAQLRLWSPSAAAGRSHRGETATDDVVSHGEASPRRQSCALEDSVCTDRGTPWALNTGSMNASFAPHLPPQRSFFGDSPAARSPQVRGSRFANDDVPSLVDGEMGPCLVGLPSIGAPRLPPHRGSAASSRSSSSHRPRRRSLSRRDMYALPTVSSSLNLNGSVSGSTMLFDA